MTRGFHAADDNSAADEAGISAIDLAELPADHRKIMLALLREQGRHSEGASLSNLRKTLGQEIANFDAAIEEMVRDSWITVSGDGAHASCRILFRRRRSKDTAYSLWSALSDQST
jgi:DNA-binding MarR family transcriptional regulator